MLVEIHHGLANAAMMFSAVLGIWAIVLRVRSRALDGAWYGAMLIGMALIAAQAALGAVMYLQGYGAELPRPLIHILYGVVGLITLPAAYAYLSSIEDENTKTILMALVCWFLFVILERAQTVALFLPTVN